jgi:8-oxo-dGTP pyrophosphatase MutT (NUDIX family)
MINRSELPYRKNCEGYFVYKGKYVIARDTGLGYLEFPGGGVESGNITECMRRETLEETGAVLTKLEPLELIYFDWDEHWAKTAKQKARYKIFRGEEMHLYLGKVSEIGKPTGDPETGEPGWPGKPYMEIEEAIRLTNSFRPFRPEMSAYHEKQLQILESLLRQ